MTIVCASIKCKRRRVWCTGNRNRRTVVVSTGRDVVAVAVAVASRIVMIIIVITARQSNEIIGGREICITSVTDEMISICIHLVHLVM